MQNNRLVLKKIARSTKSALPQASRSVTTIKDIAASKKQPSWSKLISFTTPEADFTSDTTVRSGTSVTSEPRVDVQEILMKNTIAEANWSGTMSFASPETDYTTTPLSELSQGKQLKMNQDKEAFMEHVLKEDAQLNDLVYSLSQAHTERDFTCPKFMNLLDTRMKNQLKHSSLKYNSLEHVVAREHSPLNLKTHRETSLVTDYDISQNLQDFHNDPRAIVITENTMPFRIVSVNSSWEKLCGYTADECRGMTLECIQGPKTNKSAITALMSQLLKGEEAGTNLTNYTKDKTEFVNRLNVGPLKNRDGVTTHFVGFLSEVNKMSENTSDVSMMHV